MRFRRMCVALAGLAALAFTAPPSTAEPMALKAPLRLTPEFFDSGVPYTESDVLAKLWTDAAGRVQDIVLHPYGMTSDSQEYRQARAAEQLGQIRTILKGLDRPTSDWIAKNVGRAYAAGIKRADIQAADVGVRSEAAPVQGSFGLIDTGAVNVFAHDIALQLDAARQSTERRADFILRATSQHALGEDKINTILAGGVIQGVPREAVRTLRAELEKAHNGQMVTVIDKNGDPINYKAGYYADMTVRTRTRAAMQYSRHERLGKLGLDLVMVLGRISDNFCSAYLGKVYSLSGRTSKYPAYSELPPIPMHPNCSKSTRPFVEALATPAQLRAAQPGDDVDAFVGVKDTSELQRLYKSTGMKAQVVGRYQTTERKLFAA